MYKAGALGIGYNYDLATFTFTSYCVTVLLPLCWKQLRIVEWKVTVVKY